jgi:hypothetical protein
MPKHKKIPKVNLKKEEMEKGARETRYNRTMTINSKNSTVSLIKASVTKAGIMKNKQKNQFKKDNEKVRVVIRKEKREAEKEAHPFRTELEIRSHLLAVSRGSNPRSSEWQDLRS